MEIFKPDGSVKDFAEWPEDIRRACSSIKINEIWAGGGDDRMQVGVMKEVKFWPKIQSLELLGKHLKLFTDRLEVEGEVTLADAVRRGRRRANLDD